MILPKFYFHIRRLLKSNFFILTQIEYYFIYLNYNLGLSLFMVRPKAAPNDLKKGNQYKILKNIKRGKYYLN